MPFNPEEIERLCRQYQPHETEELLEIWTEHDTQNWTDEVFEAIRQILLTRMDSLPEQKDTISLQEEKQNELENLFAGIDRLIEEDQLEEALRACESILQTRPRLAQAHYYQGIILDEMGRLEEAIAAYQRSLELDPGLNEAFQDMQVCENELVRKNTPHTERIWAAFAHASAVIPIFGIFIPISISLSKKGDSKYLAYQSLQAIIYQALITAVDLVVLALFSISFLYATLGFACGQNGYYQTTPEWLQSLLMTFPLKMTNPLWIRIIYTSSPLVWAAMRIQSLIGVIATLTGIQFRYLGIGRLARP